MRILYVFASPSCETCREAEPYLHALQKETMGTPPIVKINPNLYDWRVGGFHPRYTPSYAIVELGRLVGAVEGQLLTLEQLRTFIKDPPGFAVQQKAARKAALAADDEEEDE